MGLHVEKAGKQDWTNTCIHVQLNAGVPRYMLWNAGNKPTSHTL